jgi:gliding motility-associated-like protein
MSAMKIDVTDSVFCQGAMSTFTGIFPNSGNTNLTWNFGDNNDTLRGRNPVSYNYNYPDSFLVTLKATFRACPEEVATRKIWVMPQPQINLGTDTVICQGGNPILLSDKINGSNLSARWIWSTGQTGSSIYVGAPGEYFVQVNLNGCFASDTIMIGRSCYMDVPNSFTPNGDGVNDYFLPRQYLTRGLTQFKMDVYNRWGEMIFTTTTLDGRGWDGTFHALDQPQGVYVYVIDATFDDGHKEHQQGNVTLLR